MKENSLMCTHPSKDYSHQGMKKKEFRLRHKTECRNKHGFTLFMINFLRPATKMNLIYKNEISRQKLIHIFFLGRYFFYTSAKIMSIYFSGAILHSKAKNNR